MERSAETLNKGHPSDKGQGQRQGERERPKRERERAECKRIL